MSVHPMGTLKAALDWAARGKRVFPLRPNSKYPFENFDWTNLATTDEATIRAWWTDPATGEDYDYNIGECTTGIVVLDLDDKKGKEGTEAYRLMGGDFDTLTVRTPTGGHHLHFYGPDSSQSSPWEECGIDVRSHNGYVLAPGSRTPEGEYRIENDAPMKALKPAFASQLRPVGAKRSREGDAYVELDTEQAVHAATNWLQYEPPAVSGQGGNNRTYQVAVRAVRDFGLSEGVATALICEHYNPRCIPPWSVDEIAAFCRHAWEYGQNQLGAQRVDTNFGNVHVPTPAAEKAPRAFGIYEGNAPDIADLKPFPWLIRNLALRGETSVLAALGAGGKSTMQLVFAAHLSQGRSLGRFEIVERRPLKVMVYNMEDTINTIGVRLAAVCSRYGFEYEKVRENIVIVAKGMIAPLCVATKVAGIPTLNGPDVEMMRNLITHHKVDVAMLDPLVLLHKCNENDTTEMRYVISVLDNVFASCGCAGIIAHHGGKGAGSKGPSTDMFRGASAIADGVRVGVTITPPTEQDEIDLHLDKGKAKGLFRVDAVKANYMAKSDKALAWLKWESVNSPGTGELVGVPVPLDLADEKKRSAEPLARMIRDLLVSDGAGVVTLAKLIKHLKTHSLAMGELSDQAVRTRLTRLFREPVVIEGDTVVLSHESVNGTMTTVIGLA